jgi:hypothetical protein
MNTVQVDLSLDQLKQALHRLSATEKVALWRFLDDDLDRAAIARRFASTVSAIRKAHAGLDEGEVMADAVKATREVRRAKNRP